MHDSELIRLGKIAKIHGFNGGVVIALEDNFSEKIENMESVFVECDGKPVPFLIESVSVTAVNTAIVKFRFYDSDTRVAEFAGATLYTMDDGTARSGRAGVPLDLVGYTVVTPEGTVAGMVVSILSLPMQVLLDLETRQGEKLMVPFHPDLVVGRDSSSRTITLDLPEDIISLNR